jgi:hypothetical protein
MPIATNPQTGETVYLGDDGAWKPAQTAVNPQTKQMMAYDGKSWAEVPAKSKGVLNYIDDAVRSIANGVTFGFADEIAAKGNELLGRGTYDENVKQERARDEQIPAAIAVPGQIAGAMAVPIGAAAGGVTMGAKMLRGAGVGGLFGAASGAGQGEDFTDRAAKAAVGGVAGAAIGAVAPPLVEGAIQGARVLAQPVVNAVRGAMNPADEAARRVATGLQRDVKIDPQANGRLTGREFVEGATDGTPVTIMDLGGETTRALARSAANTSPEGRQLLNNTINDRFEGQSSRVNDWFRSAFNYPDAHAQQRALEETAKKVNTPAYAKAMREGGSGVWDDELQRLAGAPAIQEAARGSIPSLANRGITEGFDAPRRNPLSFNPETGLATLSKLPNGNERVPDLRFWDQVKRNLDPMISKAEANGDASKVGELTGLKNALIEHLDKIAPSYKEARSGAAHFFQAENALEAGQNFVTKNFATSETRAALAKMSEAERKLFQDGFVSRYVDTLNQVGDRRSILNQIAANPAAREKIQIALGPQKAAELEARLRVEGIMDLARGAVQGNSTTARQLAELGFAGGAGSLGAYGTYNMDPKEMGASAVAAALLAGKKGIDTRVAQQVAKMLVSSEPQQALRGLNLIAKNSKLMDALRSADRKIAGAGGEQVPKIGVSAQVPAISAANDQPEVPRPPAQ